MGTHRLPTTTESSPRYCDLPDGYRNEMTGELQSYGFSVLPESPLTVEFEAFVSGEMEKSGRAIFLLGTTFDPFIEKQIQTARELSKPSLFCIHTGQAGDKALGLKHYEAAGKLAGALNKHADTLFESLCNEIPSSSLWIEKFFRCLTTLENGRRIRRPTKMVNICKITGASEAHSRMVLYRIAETYGRRDNSLVVWSGDDLAGDSIIDLTHELLIYKWERLKEWKDAEADAVKLYRAAAENIERKRAGRYAKWREGTRARCRYGHAR